VKLLLLALIAIAAALKLLQDRIGRGAYMVMLVIVVGVPVAAVLYGAYALGAHGIGVREVALLASLYVVTGIGITVGFHRLLTHRAFTARPAVRVALLGLGSMAAQGRCIDWAAHHLKHHAHADAPGDPHSPMDGFLHAHIGWVFRGSPAERERYCRHLLDDRVVRAIDATAALWVALGLAVPYLVAGWDGLLWGGLVRIALLNHASFAVNSFGHALGSRRFATDDDSRNSLPLALISFGEGWHNNHHAFPGSAYFGHSRREPDPGGWLIRGLARAGLAADVHEPQESAVARRLAAGRQAAGGG
jgi:stearoyl-CoA desaturase (delta-9 desaturase)